MTNEKKSPDLQSLKVREIVVDTDDPRWQVVPTDGDYVWVGSVEPKDFEAKKRGKVRVRYTFLTLLDHQWSGAAMILEVQRWNLSLPDRAVAEAVINEHWDKGHPVMCFYPSPSVQKNGVFLSHNGLTRFYNTIPLAEARWPRFLNCLVIVSEEPV